MGSKKSFTAKRSRHEAIQTLTADLTEALSVTFTPRGAQAMLATGSVPPRYVLDLYGNSLRWALVMSRGQLVLDAWYAKLAELSFEARQDELDEILGILDLTGWDDTGAYLPPINTSAEAYHRQGFAPEQIRLHQQILHVIAGYVDPDPYMATTVGQDFPRVALAWAHILTKLDRYVPPTLVTLAATGDDAYTKI